MKWRGRVGIAAAIAVLASMSTAAAEPESTVDGLRGDTSGRSITYVGAIRDVADLAEIQVGSAGYWFPQIGASDHERNAPTDHAALDRLPAWVGAFNHTESPVEPGCEGDGDLLRGCAPTYYFRTFSQDGPARSASDPRWASIVLPTGECVVTGAIVDPHTYVADQEYDDPTGVFFPRQGQPKPNNNNTINRIQLLDGVPESFHVAVLTDNTAGEHDPSAVVLRGNVGRLDVPGAVADSQVEASYPVPVELEFNGIPDLYVYRVDGFEPGDYLKLRLRGTTSAASFGGLLFDREAPAPGAGGSDCRRAGAGATAD